MAATASVVQSPVAEDVAWTFMSRQELLDSIKKNQEWIAAAEKYLMENGHLAEKYDGKNEDDMTEEEIQLWQKARGEIRAAKDLIPSSRKKIKEMEKALAMKTETPRSIMEQRAASPLSVSHSSKSVSSVSSHSKRLEIDVKRQMFELESQWEDEAVIITEKIGELKLQLEEADGEDKQKLSSQLKKEELALSNGENRLKMKKSRLLKKHELDKEELQVELEEEQRGSDQFSDADQAIPKWLEGVSEKHFTPLAHPLAVQVPAEKLPIPPPVHAPFPKNVLQPEGIMQYPRFAHHLVNYPNSNSGGPVPIPQHDHGGNHRGHQPIPATMDPFENMTKALTDAFRSVKGEKDWEPRDLPVFDGVAEDWPIFAGEFYRTTPSGKVNSSQNAIRLRKSLKGPAREAVMGLLNEPKNVTRIMDVLKMTFGRNEFVISSLIEKADACKPPDEQKPETFLSFARTVDHLVETVKSLGEARYLNDTTLLKRLVKKLPKRHMEDWLSWIHFQQNMEANLLAFGQWLDLKTVLMVEMTDPIRRENTAKPPKSTRGPARTHAISTPARKDMASNSRQSSRGGQDKPKDRSVKCTVCEGSHIVRKCAQFKKLELEDRRKLVRDVGLCFRCLEAGHMVSKCPSDKQCGIDGCQRAHHRLLHDTGIQGKEQKDASRNDGDHQEPAVVRMNTAKLAASNPLSVCRVKVRGPKGVRKIYCLLDSGCDTTTIEDDVLESIGVEKTQRQSTCKGIGGIEVTTGGVSGEFEVAGSWKEAPFYPLSKAVIMTDLGMKGFTQDPETVKADHPYLKRAKLECFKNVKIQMIIGEDNAKLTAHRQVLEGRDSEPVAKRTRLGWVLGGQGCVKENSEARINVARFGGSDYLDQIIARGFSLESYGVYPKANDGSIEDQRAQKMLENSVKKVENGWECPLLWRDPSVQLPDSRAEAVCRLISNERRMARDCSYSSLYYKELEKYLAKGYISEVDPNEKAKSNDPRIFYIPHFGVSNVNKPGKLRLVFDAAAKVKGRSLNDHLMTGPDLIRPLPSVLMNFRRHNIAINGDIEEMFHRVAVSPEDRNSQRFVFRDLREETPVIKDYVMNVLIFGACSSPSSAIFVKNRNAQEFITQFPEAAKVVVEDFYCDDCLSGAETIEAAIRLRKEISHINAQGNFNLKKWLSSSTEVMESISVEDRSSGSKTFGDPETQLERVLGLLWNPGEDHFTFVANFKKVKPELLEGVRPTKRQMCGLLMSVFDPLGFLANFKIKGLILLQRTWRTGIDWDDELPDSIYDEWKLWVARLPEVNNVKIPRCYSWDIHLATDVQLHTMVDASEEATSAVCFLRITMGQTVSVAFVVAKAKVAPTKKLTIPRLELVAAVMGTVLASTVMEDLRVTISSRHFWTDSRTVLMWIRAETLRYKEFVANRINRIQLLSNVREWKWVPGAQNVADQATRLQSKIDLEPDSSWLTGPPFLYKAPGNWPQEPSDPQLDEEEAELKKSVVLAMIFQSHPADGFSAVVDMRRFSSYPRMVRAQLSVLVAATKWLQKLRTRQGSMTNVTWTDAEELLIRKAQAEAFPEEVAALTRGDPLPKPSRIWKMSPVLENGLLKSNSRIQAADVSHEQKTPIILPSRHKFTQLLILEEHKRNAHQGHETVLNQLRARFWILEGRNAVRRAVEQCTSCKLDRAKPIMPRMGILPYYRLETGNPPFTHTGVDLMGPLEVVVGRRHEKRWVIVFTCMVTRAVFLDVVYGLSTDETMLALSRFIDQRGRPRHIYSDNGTNFVGAYRELKSGWGTVDWEKVLSMDKFQPIQWHFNPPYTPHFGGAWERMVQSTKKILRKTLQEKFPKDQTLLTMLKGAENIINSRPLSYVSSDPADPDPLTPNHFLRGFADIGPSLPGEFEPRDEIMRAQWRRAQFFLELFWKRWTNEVLPELWRRDKWHADVDPLGVGDIVLMTDDSLPRNQWRKAVVESVLPGKDGQVRVVTLRTADRKIWKRGVDRICPLGLKIGKSGTVPDFGGRNVVG